MFKDWIRKLFPGETVKPSNLLIDKLSELPNNSPDIATHLLKAGIKGIRGSCTRCPVAVYLKQCNVVVVTVNGAQYYTDEKWGNLDLPDSVVQFIKDFDGGAYPELDMFD